MKRSLITFVMVLAVVTALPAAARQFQFARQAGANWLRDRMLEGFVNAPNTSGAPSDRGRCGSQNNPSGS